MFGDVPTSGGTKSMGQPPHREGRRRMLTRAQKQKQQRQRQRQRQRRQAKFERQKEQMLRQEDGEEEEAEGNNCEDSSFFIGWDAGGPSTVSPGDFHGNWALDTPSMWSKPISPHHHSALYF